MSPIWMPLYTADWDQKTRHLDCEQDGAYGRFVRHYWHNGPLPDDDAALARIIGMSLVRWRKIRPALAPFFKIHDGKWFHERVDQERKRAAILIEKRRRAGSARHKTGQHMLSTCSANAQHMLIQSQPQSQDPKKESHQGDITTKDNGVSEGTTVGLVVPFEPRRP